MHITAWGDSGDGSIGGSTLAGNIACGSPAGCGMLGGTTPRGGTGEVQVPGGRTGITLESVAGAGDGASPGAYGGSVGMSASGTGSCPQGARGAGITGGATARIAGSASSAPLAS